MRRTLLALLGLTFTSQAYGYELKSIEECRRTEGLYVGSCVRDLGAFVTEFDGGPYSLARNSLGPKDGRVSREEFVETFMRMWYGTSLPKEGPGNEALIYLQVKDRWGRRLFDPRDITGDGFIDKNDDVDGNKMVTDEDKSLYAKQKSREGKQ